MTLRPMTSRTMTSRSNTYNVVASRGVLSALSLAGPLMASSADLALTTNTRPNRNDAFEFRCTSMVGPVRVARLQTVALPLPVKPSAT